MYLCTIRLVRTKLPRAAAVDLGKSGRKDDVLNWETNIRRYVPLCRKDCVIDFHLLSKRTLLLCNTLVKMAVNLLFSYSGLHSILVLRLFQCCCVDRNRQLYIETWKQKKYAAVKVGCREAFCFA